MISTEELMQIVRRTTRQTRQTRQSRGNVGNVGYVGGGNAENALPKAPVNLRPLVDCWWRWESFLDEMTAAGQPRDAVEMLVRQRAAVHDRDAAGDRDRAAAAVIAEVRQRLSEPPTVRDHENAKDNKEGIATCNTHQA